MVGLDRTALERDLADSPSATSLQRFTQAEVFELTAEFVEAESGKGADALDRRPQLAAALAAACGRKCAAMVAKLDRLSRDVAFISGLVARARALHHRRTRR